VALPSVALAAAAARMDAVARFNLFREDSPTSDTARLARAPPLLQSRRLAAPQPRHARIVCAMGGEYAVNMSLVNN